MKMPNTRLYLDTEFTKLGPIHSEAKLISIGLITEDGESTFYSELTDGYDFEDCSVFVKETVLPLLDAPVLPEVIDYQVIYARMTTEQTRTLLKVWLEQFSSYVVMCSDAIAHDGHFIDTLFAGYPWPKNLETKLDTCVPTNNLRRVHKFFQNTEDIFLKGEYRRHHALDDAKVMRLAALGA
ncbi:hypothetical protein [Methylophilus luteus]|uniref:Uncharacterized protein n=1 Tax=Methylophilus luteus TaxID=640108 RepID=A0ABW3FA78_9PROT